MNIYKANISDIDNISELIAKFRVELLSYKNIQSDENIEKAKEEFTEYINADYPIYTCKENEKYLGYLVCRIDKPVVWVESLYVLKEFRRKGIASVLYTVAEDLAKSYGEDTLYVYVHPNNDKMITFLNKRDYNVLNLIEIRKKYNNEKTTEKIRIRNNVFNY